MLNYNINRFFLFIYLIKQKNFNVSKKLNKVNNIRTMFYNNEKNNYRKKFWYNY